MRQYIMSRFPDKNPNSKGEIHTRCPFHDDSSPSFSINIESGMFVCGSPRCSIRGSFAYFYKICEGIESWAQVYRDLRVTDVTPDIESLFAAEKQQKSQYWVSTFPQSPQVEPVRSVQYLVDRGIGAGLVERFGILYGCSGTCAGIIIEDSLVVPVFDLNGSYLTFQVRYLSPQAKLRWRTPLGSPIQHILYGGWLVDSTNEDLWIVEGPSDVWNMAKLGIQAVGLFTKAASSAQLNRLRDLCVRQSLKPVVCMDGDAIITNKAGRVIDYGQRVSNELCAFGLDPVLVHLNRDEDPGMLSEERAVAVRSAAEG